MSSPFFLSRLLLRFSATRGVAGWLSFAAFLALLVILTMLMLLPFKSQQSAALADLREALNARAMTIGNKLGEVAYQVSGQREAAEALLEPHTALPPSPLYAYLADDASASSFGLNHVPATMVTMRVGNIYGLGSFAAADEQLQREVQMALWLFSLHRAALRATPELAAVYYDSVQPMQAISPWVSHQSMVLQTRAANTAAMIRQLQQQRFITQGEPAQNPKRLPCWSRPYPAGIGQGSLISYGAPVYEGNTFKGIVGADLRLDFLAAHMKQERLAGGRLFVVQGKSGRAAQGTVIASSESIAAGKAPPSLAGMLGLPAAALEDVLSTEGEFQPEGRNYLIAVPVQQADWWLVYQVPRSRVLLNVVEQLRPAAGIVVALLLLLILTFHRLRRSTLALQQQATRDALTGALNRRALFAAIEQERARQRRGGSFYALIMIDIDFFKQVNDLNGHGGGDEVLRQVASVLQANLRDTDRLARVGGEEFVVLLPGSDPATAMATAERLRKQVEALRVVVCEKTIQVTISLGVTVPAYADEAIDTTYQRADVALYAAKYAGRNCCKPFFLDE
ncbi:putative diguanylate cyclase YdaM [Andreprevotia sp. IGB-42]|uniref:sensor domain-containing diguanylate cyclase n=1 Tax=Andreprevotia sp. IGB-42 TaxID=2497473 RepID=UPI001357E299|nr:sensor domain-containing diguanylate cyclase [Andreprevotia sp. IGB-42]KAF0815237.1 putative diguanylate cyclase YdaM [Andreprevotia sp. IGB-42]